MTEQIKAVSSVEDAKTEGVKETGGTTYRDMMGKLNELESAIDGMNKSARLRGFTEGCVSTLGVVAAVGLMASIIINRKDK